MRWGFRGLTLLHAASVAGWLMLLWSVVPIPTPEAIGDFNLGRIGIAVGPTCSVILALRRLTLPVAHVFEAGRRAGLEEAESRPEGRHLRVVDD
jgi:hypothetical protein